MSKIKMPVEKSHIMMFARSIGDANPKYYEEKDVILTSFMKQQADQKFYVGSSRFILE